MLTFTKFNDMKTSNEAIGVQDPNDWFVREATSIVNEAYNAIEKEKSPKPYARELERIIYKRFGIPSRVDPEDRANMACYYFGFDSNQGYLNMADFINNIREYLKKKRQEGENNSPKVREIKSMDESYSAFDLLVRKGTPIKIDEKNAKIEGIPDNGDIYVKFAINFEACLGGMGISKNAISPRKVVALILHEIGHAFTFISAVYKTRADMTLFEDVLRDNLKKNKGYKDSYLIAYAESYGRERKKEVYDKYKDSSLPVVIIGLMREISSDIYSNNKIRYCLSPAGTKDAEVMADNFAVRFGLGEELASALHELHTGFFRRVFNGITLSSILLSAFLYSILVFLVYLALAPGLAFTVLTFIISGCVGLAVSLLFNLINYMIDINVGGWPYDDDFKREERIYLELIRQIRLHVEDNEMKQTLYKKAEYIRTLLDDLKRKGVLDWVNYPRYFKDLIFRGLKTKREADALSYEIERIQENDLHLSVVALNSLK